MNKFNVLLWNFNTDSLQYYDVLPYLRECYKKAKKKPKTVEELKEFIKNESIYRYWSRCEYEMILTGWPPQKKDHKLDVHEQIMMNIDIVTNLLYNELCVGHQEKKIRK